LPVECAQETRLAPLLAGLGLSLHVAALAAQSPGLGEPVERWDHLRVGDAVSVSNLLLTAGHFQFLTKKDYMPFFEKYYWGTAMPPA
jgi:hypothetical protein